MLGQQGMWSLTINSLLSVGPPYQIILTLIYYQAYIKVAYIYMESTHNKDNMTTDLQSLGHS